MEDKEILRDELYAISDKAENGEGLSVDQIKERISFYKKSVIRVEEMPKDLVRGNPDSLIERAIDGKLDITVIRELVVMKREWDREQARKAYIVAMGEFQKQCPTIIKSKSGGVTKTGTVAYKFAPMDVILTTKNKDGKSVKALIADNGFSYTFDTPITNEDGITINMFITHTMGHKEISTVKMPFVERTGVMSPPQVIASTMTYAKRYSFMNGFGILTGDEDNDAQGRELMEEQFNDLVKDWKSNGEIMAIAQTIEANATYRDFLSKLPKQSDVDKFTKCLEKVDRVKRQPLWMRFEKSCISMTWEKFLENLEKLQKTNIEEAKIEGETVTNQFSAPISQNQSQSTVE